MHSIVLLSGGMDSLITHKLFRPNDTPVFVHTGSRYAAHDLRRARKFAPDLVEVRLPALREEASGVVPHRNILLLALVANLLDAEQVAVSSPRGELIWDQQTAFHRAAERVLRGVTIINPLRKYTKAQAVHAWLRKRSAHELLRSRSCYASSDGQCGQCPACVKRWIALRLNGLEEHYTHDPRVYARELARSGTWRDVARYGARPAWEAWRASRL